MILQLVTEPASRRGVVGALVEDAEDMLREWDMRQQRLCEHCLARIDIGLGIAPRFWRQLEVCSGQLRAQLIMARTAMLNQLRGLLKLFGLRLGSTRAPGKRTERLVALYAQRPDLEALFAPLLASIEAIEAQLRTSSRILEQRDASDPVCARLMTVPGVGPITALTYTMSIEDPRRFARGEDVGAYAGLVPRRSQSGVRDTQGPISKAGDPMLRRSLYEAANIILTRVKRPCALQSWGRKIAEAKGPRRAKVAVARKLAVLLHSVWLNETEFRWV